MWWFFGETETTRQGITADLEAFKQQGVGGVVYYDQVHGKGEGADKVFDQHWWQSLVFASQEASLVSEFIYGDCTPICNKVETLQASDIVDLTDKLTPDGTLTWTDAPRGEWLVMRFVSVTTGGHTKHGRAEALGLECDKLSAEGTRLHWQCYTKPTDKLVPSGLTGEVGT